ncbi:hypothetical protein NLJ89_g1492 [Agrocybe chaxingu]|uniref:Uncharacterized protein n=1 Tax=Agrocybe chaxingu TaxID=84603 RepID=A0A9W8TF56_9AGAR|nr:hypothetical protein NLJ89_g1492 [Agrocybe chaxingu]
MPSGLVSAPVSSSTGGGSSGEYSAPVFSDAGSQTAPPKIASSAGGYIDQPTQGSPVPGRFEIKVRARTTASNAAFVVFAFKLAPNTTLEALFGVIEDEKMVPFMFRMVGFAYFGCRDFIYTQPTATANLTDSDNDDQSTVRATSRSLNDVDRGVWDPEYQFDKRLKEA